MKKCVLILLFSFEVLCSLLAQRKWTGAMDKAWDNPLNWDPAGTPVSSDDVLLDNSAYLDDYVVNFPAGTVTLTSLSIKPSVGKTIRLIIPPANTSSPALAVIGNGDVLIINNGGIFQNASGLASGQSIKSNGTIRINNGGTYIHNTRSAHAADIVAKLSTDDGTEEGVFEFDIPSASSTISLSNRSFGKLRLSSATYNNNVSYSGGGSNPVTVRSDLEIGERVNFSIGFANVFTIRRNLLQTGGSFNISNDNNATIVALGGHLVQTSGQITETGSAKPVLMLNGSVKQEVQIASGILNDIILRIDNAAGVELKTPMSLAYRLELKKGRIKTTPATLLTLLPAATIVADSLSASFVDGPLRKEGLVNTGHFLFPVGKLTTQRWLSLKNVSGSFTVTYKQQNPYDFSTAMDQGLDHVSSIETWTIDADLSPSPSAQVELSFDNVNSGGVSDLSSLRVATWIPGVKWLNRANTAVSGAAGAAGSVTSEIITDFSADRRLFTLGSSASNHNTLPDQTILFTGRMEGTAIRFAWQLPAVIAVSSFTLEAAEAGGAFYPAKIITLLQHEKKFEYLYTRQKNENAFRLRVDVTGGIPFYSKAVSLEKTEEVFVSTVLAGARLLINYPAIRTGEISLIINDIAGRIVMREKQPVTKGENRCSISIYHLPPGLYFLNIFSAEKRVVRKFIKL